jgi:glycine dehydrogenase subunit 2
MGMDLNTRLRKFHQAKWDEPIIFELSQPGERGVLMPTADPLIEEEVGDGLSALPPDILRQEPPALPELGQMQVLKHFLRLSQENLGADMNVDVGQGTCTMKYSPKINEQFARSPKFTEVHPLQPEESVQGILQIIHELDLFLREISGLDRFSFQPGGGSHAILGMASMVRAYHEARKEADQRDEIITTIFSHPSDYSAASVLGYKVINLYPDNDGMPDLEALQAAVSPRTAALFITNPEDTGIYNARIAEFTRTVHEAGGLCGYDQANANGILGITRAREAGFDLCFFNLHKTFSSPHGCGGPGSGALGATEALREFLPVPLVEVDGGRYFLDYDLPNTIGKIRSFYGVMPAVLKAYSWIMALGAEGLEEAARVAVLNNNYLFRKVLGIRGATAPYAEGHHRIEQVRYSWETLFNETGVGTWDITCRLADFGMHMWSSHHPFIVPEPMTLEPTESYSKAELDEYVAVLQQVSKEAFENPELVKTAPHRSVTHRPGHDTLDDPEKWAVTWRSYVKKCAQGKRDRI